MWQRIMVLVTGLTVFLGVFQDGLVRADWCSDKCRDAITSLPSGPCIPKCQSCNKELQGVRTYCPECSKKLGKCEGCGKELKPDNKEQPTTDKLTAEQEKKIAELIKQLGAEDWKKREEASAELLKIGMPAWTILEGALKEATDVEVKMRITTLLKEIPDTAAKELLFKGLANISKSKGYAFKEEIKPTTEGTELPPDAGEALANQTIEVEGLQQNPDLSYFKGKFGAEGDAELYRKGNRFITKYPGSDNWNATPNLDELGPLVLFMPTPDELNKLKEVMEKTRATTEETVDKVECKVIETSLNVEKLIKNMPAAGGAPFGMKLTAASCKVWLGKENNLIYKIEMSTEMAFEMGGIDLGEGPDGPVEVPEMKMKLSSVTKFSKYDDVSITIPDEVKKLLESKELPPPEEEEEE